jgi:endonuclease/exonuclease/phosphatase family metal-dependent hydrolase/2'-5' RNA ligase
LIKDDLHLMQGLFYFDQSTQQWIQYPHIPITSDDQKNPSTIETCLPSRCHFVTWNILFDYHHPQLIYTSQRYQSVLDKLKSLLPDVICLQEVTKPFIDLLLNQIWLHENHYYIIFMQKALDSEQTKSYGQLLLTKNFRPRSFSICPLDTTEKAADATKQIIIARFGLNQKITIDLVNLHLHSNGSRNAERKRCQTLEHLLNLKTENFMLIGDFNFGDLDLKENDLLGRCQEEVHDLWKHTYNIDEVRSFDFHPKTEGNHSCLFFVQNPGYTFDPSRNICARIMSYSQTNRRFDRYLLHLNNVYYSIENLQLVGTETIPIEESNEKQINLSDHYALQLIIDFQTRTINHRSALVILPSTKHWPMIKSFCDEDGLSFVQWPPHFNLLWPFYYLNHSLDDQLDILLPLRILLSQISSFQIQVDGFDTFVENYVSFLKPNDKSSQLMKQLFERTKSLFPACVKKSQHEYNPHLTIATYENAEQLNKARSSFVLNKPFDFPVEYVYVLQRCLKDDTQPFHILYQIPLGTVLPKLNSIDSVLKQFFETMNLYESDESYIRKQDKFTKLASCFQQLFNEHSSHHFRHSFVPYGSFRVVSEKNFI